MKQARGRLEGKVGGGAAHIYCSTNPTDAGLVSQASPLYDPRLHIMQMAKLGAGIVVRLGMRGNLQLAQCPHGCNGGSACCTQPIFRISRAIALILRLSGEVEPMCAGYTLSSVEQATPVQAHVGVYR